MLDSLKKIFKKLRYPDIYISGRKDSSPEAPYNYIKEDVSNHDYDETPVKEELNNETDNGNNKH